MRLRDAVWLWREWKDDPDMKVLLPEHIEAIDTMVRALSRPCRECDRAAFLFKFCRTSHRRAGEGPCNIATGTREEWLSRHEKRKGARRGPKK